jgi:hypothetical protein
MDKLRNQNMKRSILRMIVVSIVLLSLSGCFSSKKTAGKTDATAEEKSEVTKNERKQEVLNFKRTSCFGRCPVYKFRVYADKSCELDAQLFFVVEGAHKGQLTQAQYDHIIAKVGEINFFELQDEYDNPLVQDIATTFITVTLDSQSKSIKSRYRAPATLRDFSTEIHELAKGLKWEKVTVK